MPDSRLLGLQNGADVAVDLSSYTAMLREAAEGMSAQVGLNDHLSFEMKCVRHAVLEFGGESGHFIACRRAAAVVAFVVINDDTDTAAV